MSAQEIEESNKLNTKDRFFFYFRDSLVQQQSFKHFTAVPNNDRASNKPSWESFYSRENSDNVAWTRSGRDIRKSDLKNASWL